MAADISPESGNLDCGRPAPYPLKVAPSFRERVWGQGDLLPFYDGTHQEPIGEVWLTADENRVVNGPHAGATLGELCRGTGAWLVSDAATGATSDRFPLLVKFLFTSDKLSVQVHPPDEFAQENEGGPGKTEMWHVLGAEPGAELAVGFRRDSMGNTAFENLRSQAESGAIERALDWTPVAPGETFFVPAGTVHALGAGLTVCEIQQNSDVTYRLYDYQRPGIDGLPRALHLDKAIEVVRNNMRGGRVETLEHVSTNTRRKCLAACLHFVTETWAFDASKKFRVDGRVEVWVGLDGMATFDAGGRQACCGKGEAVVLPGSLEWFHVRPEPGCSLLRVYSPRTTEDTEASWKRLGFGPEELQRVLFL